MARALVRRGADVPGEILERVVARDDLAMLLALIDGGRFATDDSARR